MKDTNAMTAPEFATKVNQFFGVEPGRLTKILVGLRGHEQNDQPLYPDGRCNNSEPTAMQVAHLLRILALNPYPDGSSTFHRNIAHVHALKDKEGRYFVEVLADYLENPQSMTDDGLQRISFSQDRQSIVFVFRSPFHHQALSYSEVENFVVKESDIVFGETGEMKFERFSILKQSALQQVAAMLSNKLQPHG